MEKGATVPSIFILLFVAVMIIGVFFWGNELENMFFSYTPDSLLVQPKASIAKPAEGLGADIVSQVENPVEGKLPETNPFSAPINPFEKVYKNPFSQ